MLKACAVRWGKGDVEREQIHSQLLADCHYLGKLPTSAVLLNRNSILPWFVLVPDTQLNDLLDLPEEHLGAVIQDCAAISRFIKQVMGYQKVNFAGLGNVVPQMHLHVIGRSEADHCWPRPVWGELPLARPYPPDQLREFRDGLVAMAGMDPAEL